MTYTIGQRWISNTESQLGLGIITKIETRQISIHFPAADEERMYAINNAPITRIIFKENEDIITNEQKKLRVAQIQEHQGIAIYSCFDEDGNQLQVTELTLSGFIKLSTPEQRLFSGLIDKLNAFKLRIDSLNIISKLQQSKISGLLGARTNHLPHQVYIANEVAHRYAPRVLLADEVGLGKTIEAGMILHYQLHTGRAAKILIIVPETLIHQWMVEMLRRFNLRFSIASSPILDADFDYLDEVETVSQTHFFESEPLILCSLEFLMSNDTARAQALTTPWDIVVVDEAHHLHWSEEQASPEYQCIEQLAAHTKGLLLLTATPEQAGIASHFARLRLIDPSRFHNFSEFKEQELQYQKINTLVQTLLDHKTTAQSNELTKTLKEALRYYIPKSTLETVDDAIQALIDQHGTGRVLFRNTRAAIKGFPERHLNIYPLPCPFIYQNIPDMSALDACSLEDSIQKTLNYVHPETNINSDVWLEHDPRVLWLLNHLKMLYPKKVLIICASAKTAITLEQHLKLKHGIRVKAFHEHLSIIDRDRAAAYFAEEEDGAQTLICSEIGSEGRNFQFSHHLVLFDLPLNPDLLEQRIGRLDRIGQKHPIEIHVPYISDTAQERLFQWYHLGLNIFEKSASAAFSIFEHFANRLLPLLRNPYGDEQLSKHNTLITDTQAYAKTINDRLQTGRDKLLEMNSCDPVKAQELIEQIEAEEQYSELKHYMDAVFHEFAVDQEDHSEYSEILRPTEHMKTSYFPGLKDDGIVVTYSRAKALIREDMEFLSWEHPMVNESMEMILNSELGNTTVTTISIKTIPFGTVFLETFYTINAVAPKNLQLDRFLPLTPIRMVMDISGKDLSKILDYKKLNELCEPVRRHLAYPIVKEVRHDLEHMLSKAYSIAEVRMAEIIDSAHAAMKSSITKEIFRLEMLQRVNPAIRDEEITYYKNQIIDSEYYINNATLKLQALRVVINK